MKNFIDSIIRIFLNTVIIVGLLALCFTAFVILLSKSNDISVTDTLSYIKSFSNQSSDFTLTDQEPVNIYINNSINDNINISTTNNKYYYKQLNDNSKLVYDALENNIDNLKKDDFIINFSTKFNNLLNQSDGQYILNRSFQTALDAFFYDHPELFYIDLTKISLVIQYTSIGSKTTYTVSIAPQNGNNYLHDNFDSEEDVNKAVTKVENIRNNIISSLSNTNDYNKALKVHDILVNSLEYDSTTNKTNTHNIYGALTQKQVVCEGYAKTFKYILDSLNIECILVSGTGTDSSGKTEPHMWNYINLDGNWYGVDVTWDDPIIIGGSNKNIIRHDYFCKGYYLFNKSHIISNKISNNGYSFKIPTLSNKDYK